jgi:hypothetical protein
LNPEYATKSNSMKDGGETIKQAYGSLLKKKFVPKYPK